MANIKKYTSKNTSRRLIREENSTIEENSIIKIEDLRSLIELLEVSGETAHFQIEWVNDDYDGVRAGLFLYRLENDDEYKKTLSKLNKQLKYQLGKKERDDQNRRKRVEKEARELGLIK